MASNSEKTHAKNNENLHIANTTIPTIPNFDPTNPLIELLALTAFKTGFSTRLQAVNVAFTAEQTAIAAQTAAFKLVPQKVTKILKAAKAVGLSPESLDHIMTTIHRLRGVRVSDKTPDNPLTSEDEGKSNNSVSRRSIAGILESLDLLHEQLKAETIYNPNEVEFQTASIGTWIESLHTLRNSRLNAQSVTTDSRQERDSFCYGKASGLITRMNLLKAYVETILDKTDDRYKRIKALKFTDAVNK